MSCELCQKTYISSLHPSFLSLLKILLQSITLCPSFPFLISLSASPSLLHCHMSSWGGFLPCFVFSFHFLHNPERYLRMQYVAVPDDKKDGTYMSIIGMNLWEWKVFAFAHWKHAKLMMVMFSGKLVMMMMRLVQSVTAKDENWEEVGKLHTAADLGGNPLTAVLRPPSYHLLLLLLLLLLFLLLPLLLLFLLSSSSCQLLLPPGCPASLLSNGRGGQPTHISCGQFLQKAKLRFPTYSQKNHPTCLQPWPPNSNLPTYLDPKFKGIPIF